MGRLTKTLATAAAAFVLLAGPGGLPQLHAQDAAVNVQLSIKNHRFQPAEIHAPANKPIVLHLKNLDATPMEFESVPLRVEKVVTGNGEGVIRIRPLAPGSYGFYDDFHPESRGTLVVK